MSDQIYASFADLWEDQELLGFEFEQPTLDKIRGASGWIEQKIGSFIPITATKNYDGDGSVHLFVEPLLSVTSVTHDGGTLEAPGAAGADYVLYSNKGAGQVAWESGPYTRLSVDPDANDLSVWKRERDVIAIAGLWGKFNRSVATGAVVNDSTQQDASQTTILVDDAGKISPGDTLLIESEQELVTGYSGTGTDTGQNLASAIAINDQTISVATGHGINAGEILRIDNEQFYAIRAEGNNTVLVKRAWNKTTKATHSNAADVYVYRTFVVERAVNGTTAATHANAVAISRYEVPPLVKYLAVQVASLMLRKAATGYAGKSVSMEAEEVFYHHEFPKTVFKTVKKSYRC